jgi:hypothetical protein
MRILIALAAVIALDPMSANDALAAPPQPAADHVLKVETAGDKGTEKLSLQVLPLGPWKWNPEYPARLELELPPGVTATKTTLKMVDGDFAIEGKGAKAATPLSAKAPGAYVAKVKGKFGLCDAHVCIIKKVDTTATLQVK